MTGFDLLFTARTSGPDDTQQLAASLAQMLAIGDVLVLTGDLGAGKTCFTQGLGKALGIDDRITSPTFTLANRYQGRLVLNHLDVYRVESLAETESLGLGELFEDGVTVIEWGDRIEQVLPEHQLRIALRYPELDLDGDLGAGNELATETEVEAEFEAPVERIIEFSASKLSAWLDRDLAARLTRWGASV